MSIINIIWNTLNYGESSEILATTLDSNYGSLPEAKE